MATNLLDMARSAMGGGTLDQIAGVLGEDRGKTEAAVGAGLPAILAGMMQTGATPSGAREIDRLASEADGSILDNVGGMLSGSSGTLLSLGAPLASMLFGGKFDGLTSTLSRLTGIGGGAAGSLLKMLAPVVMSLLGREKTRAGLDEGGMQRLLMDQRQPVASALPAEMSDQLGFGDFLKQHSAPTAAAVEPASRATGTTTTTDTGGGGGLMKLLIPLAVVALLAWLAYTFLLGNDDPEPAPVPEGGVESSVDTGALANPGELGTRVITAIEGVENEQTAREAAAAIDTTVERVEGLGDQAKAAAVTALSGARENIEGALESAYEIDGVEAILKPAADKLMGLMD